MIRLLTENDRDAVLEYLYRDPAYNIFIIGDIETFGFDEPFQRVYAECDDEGTFLSVFLRYRDNAIYYADTLRFNKAYLPIFKKDPFSFISGKTDLMNLINPYLNAYKKYHTYFCEAKTYNLDYEVQSEIKRMTTLEDAHKIYDLISSVEEFSEFTQDKENYADAKMKSIAMGVTLYLEENGKALSTVATTAETSQNAMVVAVATHEDARNKGYASRLMKALMYEYLVKKHKHLCLFYDNPGAGKIYHRLGFELIGTWDMYKKI